MRQGEGHGGHSDDDPQSGDDPVSAMAATAQEARSVSRDAEADFVQRLVAGEESAYRDLYRHHVDEVFRLARRFVYSDAEAEEVVQEVFLAAYKAVGRFRGQSRLRTWLYRITVNRALKRRRWWTRRREVGAEALDTRSASGTSPDRRAADREALLRVQHLLDGLEPRKRTVLVLHELEGLDTREIAEILQCPRSTVLTRLSRARQELIRQASEQGVHLGEGDR